MLSEEAVVLEQSVSNSSPDSRSPKLDLSQIRNRFPILSREIHGHPLAFLDNASTTQKPDSVIQAMVDFFEQSNSNVSRGVYTLAEEATENYEEARKTVAKLLNAVSEDEVIFTSGTTAAVNLVAQSWAFQQLKVGDRILVTEMEHHSNLVPWQQICKQLGIELDYWTIDREGRLDLEDLNQLLSENTKLVAMTAISNVLGSINPVGEVVKRAHSVGAAVFVDAAQAVARMPIDVQKWDCDFLAFSGHKLYGPTGIGVLWVKQEQMQKMNPWQTGGGMISKVDRQESHWASGPAKFEAGTPPVAQAAGLTAAIDFILETGFDSITRHETELTQICLDKLQGETDVEIYGPANMESRAGVVSFNLRGVHPHDVAQVLNESGIAVRAGHHCTQVLHSKLGLQASVRLSVGVYNTEEEILRLVTSLQHVRDLLK